MSQFAAGMQRAKAIRKAPPSMRRRATAIASRAASDCSALPARPGDDDLEADDEPVSSTRRRSRSRRGRGGASGDGDAAAIETAPADGGLGAIKAVSAASLALRGDGIHLVSLDVCIETMRQTGRDMHEKYKETSLGRLAVNVPNC